MINSEPQPIKWYKTWWGLSLIAITAIIVVLFLAFAIYVFYLANKIKSGDISQQISQMLQPGPYQMENDTSPWTGSANPKLTIVEFGDFNCPFCKKSYSTIREISHQYKDEVKIIFRHYPLTQENSLDLALASECSNEQNLFWHMHDKFFQTTNPGEKINLIAKQIGLDLEQFNTCFTQKKYLNKIRLDVLDAQKAEIKGTPTWFINGHKFEGEIPRDAFLQVIEVLLSN